MKAITVRCPDCGAQLKADRGLTECTYCGTSIMIEGSHALPASPTPATDSAPAPPGASISPAAIVLVCLAVLGIALLGFFSASEDYDPRADYVPAPPPSQRAAPSVKPEAPPVPMITWAANVPVVRDVNADEVDDVITFFEGTDDKYHASILSGVDMQRLWLSDSIPGIDEGEPRIFLSRSAVLASGSVGNLTGYSVRDGGTLWTIRLAEVVIEVADVGENLAVVKLKDKSRVRLDLERGAILPAEASDEEIDSWILSTSDGDTRGGAFIQRAMGGSGQRPAPHRRFFDDFRYEFTIWSGDVSLCIGKRAKGTEVPMIVRFERLEDDGRQRPVFHELWRATVPGVEPLKARLPTGFSTFFHASEAYATVAYIHQGTSRGLTASRMAGFDMADGRRLWDQDIPKQANLTSLTVMGDRVYLVTWKGLTVLAGPTGETLFSIHRMKQ